MWPAAWIFEALYVRGKQIECSRPHLRISWSFLVDHYNCRCLVSKLIQSLVYALLLRENKGKEWGHTIAGHVLKSKAFYPMINHNGKEYEKECVYIYTHTHTEFFLVFNYFPEHLQIVWVWKYSYYYNTSVNSLSHSKYLHFKVEIASCPQRVFVSWITWIHTNCNQ